MMSMDGIFNLLAATAALAAQDGDEMTGRVLALVTAGPPTLRALPLALRYAETALEGSLSPRVRSALQALLAAAEVPGFTGFKVRLLHCGPNKIPTIKLVRELTGKGLGEAKALVEGAPSELKIFEQLTSAEEARTRLEALGCRVELIPLMSGTA